MFQTQLCTVRSFKTPAVSRENIWGLRLQLGATQKLHSVKIKAIHKASSNSWGKQLLLVGGLEFLKDLLLSQAERKMAAGVQEQVESLWYLSQLCPYMSLKISLLHY